MLDLPSPFTQVPECVFTASDRINVELKKALDALFGADESRQLPSPVEGLRPDEVEGCLAQGFALGYLALLKRIYPELRVMSTFRGHYWRPVRGYVTSYVISNHQIEAERAADAAKRAEQSAREAEERERRIEAKKEEHARVAEEAKTKRKEEREAARLRRLKPAKTGKTQDSTKRAAKPSAVGSRKSARLSGKGAQ